MSNVLQSANRPRTYSNPPNSGIPPCILLDQIAHIDYDGSDQNATTAEALTDFGAVKVTFFMAKPPLLSHFSVHCPGFTTFDYLRNPRINLCVDNVALLTVSFTCGSTTEYFLYKCGHGRRPTLQHLEDVGKYLNNVLCLASVGFLPRGDDGNFMLVALAFPEPCSHKHELHVFCNEKRVWSTKLVLLENLTSLLSVEKVVILGAKLGFVDLWKGILICDVNANETKVRFIPFPQMLPGNLSKDQTGSARLIRDVVFSDGFLRCVEIEHEVSEKPRTCNVATKPKNLSLISVFHDEDLMPVGNKQEVVLEYRGWNIIAWKRDLNSSACCWHKEYMFSASDISVSNSSHNRLLCDLGGGNCSLRDLFTVAPTLTLDFKNSLYLMSMVKTNKRCSVMVVDMKKQKLEYLKPVSRQRLNFSSPTHFSTSISKYLSMGSDGTCTDEQIGLGCLNLEPQPEETANLCSAKALRDNYPRAQLYSIVTSPGIVPCSYQQQHRLSEVASPLWQRSSLPSPPSDESRIGWRDGSWSASTFQTDESIHSCITSSDDRSPGIHNIRDSSPVTPCGQIPFYASHQQLQQDVADTLLQPPTSSWSCSSNYQNHGGYYHFHPIIPSEVQYRQQPPPLSWYSPSLQKRQVQAGAPLFQRTSRLSSSRFAGKEVS
ncbi:hypothetical protein EJB05_07854 [Eragrostis curvula]|uniref:DUF1618 domain-containing protein n=1 Tax=Eragrostis curvula TaxID=38414 RepID=A0A5J9WJT3_9POAL|nr:hypothetical protein EJB05_07854 [Eragrostis curvula]